ncbi:hypothetical protein BU15DRAFT_51483 [Melanogaster broomeanus]|nr:hypothetical protein BU15DRAFT_51483 [Melanogaster broomeanus]
MIGSNGASPYDLVGPALLQALQLARYQALRDTGKKIVSLGNENDVINQRVTHEEERILCSNASVVSALEDLFSWRHKDRTSKISRLSYVESWKFRRAMYRIWIMSTLYGHGASSTSNGQPVLAASFGEQKAFLQQFTSQELVQISKVAIFLQSTASWAIFAERKLIGSLDVYDFDSLYLYAGPRVVLRCYEEASSNPLPSPLPEDELYDDFLMPSLREILNDRNASVPPAFIGSILDEIHGEGDKCAQVWLYHPRSVRLLTFLLDWGYLKGTLESPSETFVKLPYNLVEKPLFQVVRSADYSTLFHELFACRGDSFAKWSKEDWLCYDCIQNFFQQTLLRWWRDRKVRGNFETSDLDMCVPKS